VENGGVQHITTMDTLTKKKEIRQKLQRKLTNQAAEIKRLKREVERKDNDIRRLGGVMVERDHRGTRIGIEMRVDERESRHYAEVWDRVISELGYKLGRAVWEEQTKQAFSCGLRPPHEMEDVKNEWMRDMMYCALYRSLNSRELESAWNSALEAITKAYANPRLSSRRLPDCVSMGGSAEYDPSSCAPQSERVRRH
jgi:hypothetical protein